MEAKEKEIKGKAYASLLCDFMFKRLFGSEANKDVLIGFKDGTEIRIGYPKENLAVWWIEIEKTGGAAYAMNRCDDQDAEIYSDVFSIDSEVAWHKVVRKGEKKA